MLEVKIFTLEALVAFAINILNRKSIYKYLNNPKLKMHFKCQNKNKGQRFWSQPS